MLLLIVMTALEWQISTGLSFETGRAPMYTIGNCCSDLGACVTLPSAQCCWWGAELREMPLDTGSGTWQGEAPGPGRCTGSSHPPALLALHRELAAPLCRGPEVRQGVIPSTLALIPHCLALLCWELGAIHG